MHIVIYERHYHNYNKEGDERDVKRTWEERRNIRRNNTEVNRVMEITKTIKVRLLEPNRNKVEELKETLRSYSQACNMFIHYLQGKKLRRSMLNGDVYKEVRSRTGLPTVLVQNARDVVIEAMKSYRKKRGKKSIPDFTGMKSFRLDNRGFRIIYKPENRYQFLISMRLKNRRVTLPLECLPSHYPHKMLKEVIEGKWKVRSITVVKKRNGWWIHIPVSREVKIREVTANSTPIGVDLGAVNLAVVSTPDRVKFFSGREWWHRRRRWKRIRKRLQKQRKFRAIKKLGDKERRYNIDLAHKISREIVKIAEKYKNPVIVMEDLTNIRDRMDFTREINYKNHGWFFRRLQKFIEYKAKEKGIPVVYLPPEWTSATCPRCGDANPKNRNRKKHEYRCHYCGYTLNDDLIGARNLIRLFKNMASGYMSGAMGCMTQPVTGAV